VTDPSYLKMARLLESEADWAEVDTLVATQLDNKLTWKERWDCQEREVAFYRWKIAQLREKYREARLPVVEDPDKQTSEYLLDICEEGTSEHNAAAVELAILEGANVTADYRAFGIWRSIQAHSHESEHVKIVLVLLALSPPPYIEVITTMSFDWAPLENAVKMGKFSILCAMLALDTYPARCDADFKAWLLELMLYQPLIMKWLPLFCYHGLIPADGVDAADAGIAWHNFLGRVFHDLSAAMYPSDGSSCRQEVRVDDNSRALALVLRMLTGSRPMHKFITLSELMGILAKEEVRIADSLILQSVSRAFREDAWDCRSCAVWMFKSSWEE
jgi:hypothetical protein